MAVLIKGMEIPKCCAECDFADFRQFEEDRCSLTKTIIHFHYKGRNSDCPIVEVPEHGRLVNIEPFMRGLYEEIQVGQMTYTSQEIYDMMDKEIRSLPAFETS